MPWSRRMADAWPRGEHVEGRVQGVANAHAGIFVVGGDEFNDVADVCVAAQRRCIQYNGAVYSTTAL